MRLRRLSSVCPQILARALASAVTGSIAAAPVSSSPSRSALAASSKYGTTVSSHGADDLDGAGRGDLGHVLRLRGPDALKLHPCHPLNLGDVALQNTAMAKGRCC